MCRFAVCIENLFRGKCALKGSFFRRRVDDCTRHGERGEYSGETFYYAADNLRVKNMMDGIEIPISAENEEAYRSMILKAVQKQTEEQSTGMSQQM